MALLQQPIQRKLSSLLGANVTFEKLNLSLLGGSIEANGVTVAADDPNTPVLTIGRVVAKVAVTRALKGEIVVTSLTIERPVIRLVRRADGSTNLPKKIEPDDQAPTPAPAEAEEDKSRWSFDVEKVLLVDGRASFELEGSYHLSFEKLLAELKRDGGGYAFTLLADSVGRRDVPIELGQLRGTGRLEEVADLTQLAKAKLDASLELGDLLTLKLRSPKDFLTQILRSTSG